MGILTERDAFIKHHQHLDLTEDKDAWGEPKFAHSHVEAMWKGWAARAGTNKTFAELCRPRHIEAGGPAPIKASEEFGTKMSDECKADLDLIDRHSTLYPKLR